MQINEYPGGLSRHRLNAQNAKKTDKTFESEIYKTSQTLETQKLTDTEKLEIFKKELYKEISGINGKPPPYQLSMSINITEGAFKKMQQDPKFKTEITNTLKQNVQPNPQMMLMPFGTHVTTTVKEDGIYTYISHAYGDDTPKTKEDKKADANKKAEAAFYYQTSFSKINSDKRWLANKQSRQRLQEIPMQKINLDNEINGNCSCYG